MSNSLFEYKVRARHRLGWKEFKLYADTDIEEFFNRNSIEYVRNMTDTVEHRLLKEIDKLVDTNEDINFLISIQDLEQPEFDNACLERENERLRNQLEQKENIIKEVRDQLDYLETYSSREDVFEDIKRRLDRIESIIDKGE